MKDAPSISTSIKLKLAVLPADTGLKKDEYPVHHSAYDSKRESYNL
jgi:hypothetical protein